MSQAGTPWLMLPVRTAGLKTANETHELEQLLVVLGEAGSRDKKLGARDKKS
jgi:hypothetical protein